MTREDVKRYIGELKMYAKSQGWDEEYQIACDVAMNELEQEHILDKIRAEIEPTRKMYFDMNDIDWVNGCDYVLSVIDKYKAEKEK